MSCLLLFFFEGVLLDVIPVGSTCMVILSGVTFVIGSSKSLKPHGIFSVRPYREIQLVGLIVIELLDASVQGF